MFFLVDGNEKALKLTEDPLKLSGFFPCPAPIQFLKRNKSTIPLPEYKIYRKLAEKLAECERRKARIIKYIKAVGIYDKTSEALSALLESDDGKMIPAEMNLMGEGQQPVVGKSFEMLPIEGFARVLAELEKAIQQIKQVIYDVTGISDLMRGQSVASESATAQRIKGNFGTMRVQERQKEVARFVRDITRRNVTNIQHVVTFRGKPVKRLDLSWDKALKAAGLEDVTLYSPRTTAARWMSMQGVPLEQIAEQLGHKMKGYAVTYRYVGHQPSYLSEACAALDKLLSICLDANQLRTSDDLEKPENAAEN